MANPTDPRTSLPTQGEPPDWAALAPFPGSSLAVERGCQCPRMDNGHGDPGLARDRGGFVIVVGCPLHSPTAPEQTGDSA